MGWSICHYFSNRHRICAHHCDGKRLRTSSEDSLPSRIPVSQTRFRSQKVLSSDLRPNMILLREGEMWLKSRGKIF